MPIAPTPNDQKASAQPLFPVWRCTRKAQAITPQSATAAIVRMTRAVMHVYLLFTGDVWQMFKGRGAAAYRIFSISKSPPA